MTIVQHGALPKKVMTGRMIVTTYSDGTQDKAGYPEHLTEMSRLLTEAVNERDELLAREPKSTSLSYNGGKLAVARGIADALSYPTPETVKVEDIPRLLEQVRNFRATVVRFAFTDNEQLRKLVSKAFNLSEEMQCLAEDLNELELTRGPSGE